MTATTTTNYIPEGYHSITPYLHITGAARAIEFYKEIFGATEVMRMDAPDGKIGHAEIKIGDSHVMLADEFPEMDVRSPQSFGGSPVGLLLYVEDVDALAERAVAAGAKLQSPLEDKFYGDRMGKLVDPFGHIWAIATHKEDVSPEEMEKRIAALELDKRAEVLQS
ncbi:MAG TPA: VOC family protein [Pyrinomonadaceae bacterium]|jgi:PhnB protein